MFRADTTTVVGEVPFRWLRPTHIEFQPIESIHDNEYALNTVVCYLCQI